MSNVETAVQYALAQVGKPYVWGTAGPDTFDCSGLVMAAFRHAGFKISRVTYTQLNDGTAVTRDQMRRGDLWFTDPGHVAIFLGDGQMVEAPNSRSRVRVAPVRQFFAGRRIGAPSTVPGGVQNVGIVPDLSGITGAIGTLTSGHTWLRVLMVASGVLMLLFVLRQAILTPVKSIVDKVGG